MVEPLSAAVLGAAVLTQGIRFLYEQAGELLRRRRDRKQATAAAGSAEIPSAGEAGRVLAGQLTTSAVDAQALDRYADQLARLWGLLAPYATGLTPVDPADRQLAEQVEAARRLLEQIYRQHITFTGERRPATGSPLDVRHADDAGRYAARVIASGEGAVAVGRDIIGSTVTTGDQTIPGDRNAASRPPSGQG